MNKFFHIFKIVVYTALIIVAIVLVINFWKTALFVGGYYILGSVFPRLSEDAFKDY